MPTATAAAGAANVAVISSTCPAPSSGVSRADAVSPAAPMRAASGPVTAMREQRVGAHQRPPAGWATPPERLGGLAGGVRARHRVAEDDGGADEGGQRPDARRSRGAGTGPAGRGCRR